MSQSPFANMEVLNLFTEYDFFNCSKKCINASPLRSKMNSSEEKCMNKCYKLRHHYSYEFISSVVEYT